eukprot:gene53158-1445_t
MAGYFPRSWEFQGSLDGKEWITIRRHENDTQLSKDTPVGTW